jgi:hypothetical protein
MGKRFGSVHGLSMDIGGRIALGPSRVRFAGFAKPANAGIWIPPLLEWDAPLGRKKGSDAAFGCEKEAKPVSDEPLPQSEIILYQTEDGRTRIQCRFENETVWLTQAQMADLFQRERSVITKHIRNIFEEGELVEEAVCANYARTAADGTESFKSKGG